MTTNGDPVELELEHECGAGARNVTVRIVRNDAHPIATRTQIPQRVCLA